MASRPHVLSTSFWGLHLNHSHLIRRLQEALSRPSVPALGLSTPRTGTKPS